MYKSLSKAWHRMSQKIATSSPDENYIVTCDLCDESMKHQQLGYHLSTKHNFSICRYCKKLFESNLLENHIMNNHDMPHYLEWKNSQPSVIQMRKGKLKFCSLCKKIDFFKSLKTHKKKCSKRAKAIYKDI